MTLSVSDARSNTNDQIASAAKSIGRSKHRAKVFLAIHTGKKLIKTVADIARATGLTRKRVLEEAKKLVHKQIIHQTTRDGDTAYERDNFCYAHRIKIVALVKNPTELKKFPTKYSPALSGAKVKISVPKSFVRTRTITIDKIDSFAKVHKVRHAAGSVTMSETQFKHGVQKILNETGKFKDWGGETSDLYTTRVRINGQRLYAAIAFKGPGKKGLLTPGGMGKNGDQIQRLFTEDAQVFLVQYVGQIASSVIHQMAVFAQFKSVSTGQLVYYGTIDGTDSSRLVVAYPKAFLKKRIARRSTRS